MTKTATGAIFKRPSGTRGLFIPLPGTEVPGYYQASLRDGESRFESYLLLVLTGPRDIYRRGGKRR
jgi:hypothetical protein